jgi:hypothetical protein
MVIGCADELPWCSITDANELKKQKSGPTPQLLLASHHFFSPMGSVKYIYYVIKTK